MSNPELSAGYSQDQDASSADSNRAELKAMLDVIAAQLVDADKRHTAALAEMQERINGMGREADALRPRVPQEFAPAFVRIESAMAELAQRLSDPAELKSTANDKRSASGSSRFNDPYGSMMPMALRSAHNDARDRDDDLSKRAPAVDTFDVIDSVPGDATDPWDRAAADALAGLYETGDVNFAPKVHYSSGSVARAGSGQGVDEAWLEGKFAEIAQGIEQSLAAMRPDNGIAEISQRFDQFERQFAKLFAGVATHDDLAAVHLIESHVAEVVNHLVQTQDQLERLNIIEAQLASISHTLADVQGVPVDAITGAVPVQRAPDLDAIARAAAEQTAQRFADLRADDRHSAADELRPLIERMMSQNRQGEEHTAALLDTMQQAMIRLLDRVDAIEFVQQAATSPEPDSRQYRSGSFGGETQRRPELVEVDDEDIDEALGAVFAEISARPSVASALARPREVSASSEEAIRKGEKSRQDFVADARRAKMRLAAEQDEIAGGPASSVSISSSASEGPMAAPPAGSRPIRPAAVPSKKTSGPSAPSPRLMVIAAVALIALGGLWYTFGFGKAHVSEPSSVQQVEPGMSPQANGGETGGSTDAAKSVPGSSSPTGHEDKAADPSLGGNGPRGDLAPGDGRRENTASDAAPRRVTALPMLGVAVDLDQPVTAAGLEQAKRHQAMAEMSGELGNAAARMGDGSSVPASMVPSAAETEGAKADLTTGSVSPAPSNTSASKSSPLDMPPATVGPLSLRLAAANGDPSAQFEVGARLAEGKGTTQSFQDAAKWYQRSADQGFAQSQYRLGTLYERGLGLKPDAAQAAVWYQRAAAQGNIKAMHNLAVLSANQNDQSPDYTTAAQWFEAAAQRGLADSQFNLAVLYENGLGVTRDMKRAFMWLSIAARGGDADAVRRRDILRGKLTAEEVKAADKMIAAWKPSPSSRDINDARTAGEIWKSNPKNGMNG
ncbi:tetratricopeptide repeat protein [Hyphomicrobium sp.]|uniref:tetratricopeptide repeat protein n=1 Tax=Hyphomicrobium sp. TaxID=82 RepID=UPI001D44234C|nr:tetratricopeptide repeat protein [Hyphomicrobium sp.]MBY0558941.1 sel1 repeat family protein [Hyphomicrobium sp.]